jgi:hypothetical protein
MSRSTGDRTLAAARGAESLQLFRELNDKWGTASALSILGYVARDDGAYALAQERFSESLALFTKLGDTWGTAFVLLGLAQATLRQGDARQAATLAAESLALARDQGIRRHVAAALETMGAIAAARGRPDRGARLFAAAAALREATGTAVLAADRTAYDRQLARIKDALGGDAFAAAWAAGGTVSIDDAVAEALREPATPESGPAGVGPSVSAVTPAPADEVAARQG